MFGFPRLQKVIENNSRTEHLIDECLTALREFTGRDWDQEDDITLVMLGRTTSEAPLEQGHSSRAAAVEEAIQTTSSVLDSRPDAYPERWRPDAHLTAHHRRAVAPDIGARR
jgi:hypothetical protein